MMPKIRVHIIHQQAYIFNAKDYLQLRSTHRIIGNLVGCVLTCPRNPNVNGLPAVLSPCELRLLLQQDLAQICQPAAPPTVDDAAAYSAFCAQSVADQRLHQRECKLNESRKQIDRIVEGKRAKMRAAGASPSQCQALTAEQVLADIGEQCVFSEANALLQVPTESGPVAAAGTGDAAEAALLERAAAIAADPQQLHYRVFRDLWQRGKFVTPADTFGGDFLVYPGDPMLYHATHIVHCMRGGATIGAGQLVTAGRLSVVVNKLCVFAYDRGRAEDGDGDGGDAGEIGYQTLEWEGNDVENFVQGEDS